ncbi:Pyrimidine dimer DNA glycosylase T4 endoV family [Methanonatronarchaeum thermophilum]|uniref:Pyrimidine dimer DNA glycosylase T4 endoV family n=2 Tax=Methanonatronarchaeum thermophilum TaxID=1927129 RepID=A0A1Y3GAG3_9EURY|nr:Pyrimidine dimer DNA glycosylase T4 endoV family [Methanonatronarchaeum thermophilum]
MINPEHMCIQHILGEHRELHALMGSIERTKPGYKGFERHRNNIKALARDGYIELKSLKTRHEQLVGYLKNHNSPIEEVPTLEYIPKEVIEAEVNIEKSRKDLIDRPQACRPNGKCREKILNSENTR